MAIEPAEELDVEVLSRAIVEDAGPERLVRMLLLEAPELLGLPDTLDMLRAADRLCAWVSALQARLVAQAYEQSGREERCWSGKDPAMAFTITTTELAPLLRLSETAASRLVSESLSLTQDLPRTLEALSAGRLSRSQAAVICSQAGTLPAEAVAGFEHSILADGAGLAPPKLTDRCRRLRERLHPETISARKARAAQDRYVVLEPDRDGMAWLSAYLPAEQATGIYHRLTDGARNLQCPGESRTLAQLRADVYAALLTRTCRCAGPEESECSCTRNGGRDGDLAAIGAVQAHVFVTVPVMTLVGTGQEPGELDGYGPIDPETARMLAASAPSFTRILTHPETGAVLSVGRTRYQVPADLKNWLRVRDKTCRHPGCNRQAVNSEIDHTIPWSHGGPTDHGNLAHLCKRHHMLKTEGIWHYTQPEPGVIQAVSPAGRTYVSRHQPPP